MRGTLRTGGTVILGLVIIVFIMGCPAGEKSDEASIAQRSADQGPCINTLAPTVSRHNTNRPDEEPNRVPDVVHKAPAGKTASADGKGTDESTTTSGDFDMTRPVHEPNELRDPSRPPIIHRPRPNILPLSREQVEDIKYVVQKRTQRETWFILVLSHTQDALMPSYQVEAYAVPDRQSGRIRRGSAVYLAESLTGSRIRSFSYAHVCETGDAFPQDLAPPDDLTRFPFRVPGDISDEEILEVVQFIRSGPSTAERSTSGPRKRTGNISIRQQVLDPAASIRSISREGEEIRVHMAGPRSDTFVIYACQKIDGTWTLVNVARGLFHGI